MSNEPTSDGYIYLLITREFISQKLSVFKFGFTSNIIKRFNSYPKGSLLILSHFVREAYGLETTILKALRETFIQRKDFGREYFEGDIDNIIAMIYRLASTTHQLNRLKSSMGDMRLDVSTFTTITKTIRPEVAIAFFFETHCRQLSGPVKTLDLFKAFNESEYAAAVPMTTFMNIIKKLFGIAVKMHDFPEGSCQAILFTYKKLAVATNKLEEFLAKEDEERCSNSIEGLQYNISKVEGRVTWISDFEAAFKDCMDGPLTMDRAVLAAFGFSASEKYENVCKACKQLARSSKNGSKNCCNEYDARGRGKKMVIKNMVVEIVVENCSKPVLPLQYLRGHGLGDTVTQ